MLAFVRTFLNLYGEVTHEQRELRSSELANGVLNSYNDFIIYVVESSSHIHAIRMTSQNLPFKKTSSFK